MPKSERPKTEQHRDPNKPVFEQTCSDLGRLVHFDRSDFGIHSIGMTKMTKFERSNRLVRISDVIFCLKSEQICSNFRKNCSQTKFDTKQRGSVQNPNMFGFRHSTVI